MRYYFITSMQELQNITNEKFIIGNFYKYKLSLNNYFNESIIQSLIAKSKELSCLIFCFVYTLDNKGIVFIISDGELLDIYEESEIYSTLNLKCYNTRLGKVAILVNSDLLDDTVAFALEAFKIDLTIVFTNGNYKNTFGGFNYSTPNIIINEEEVVTNV